MKTFSMEKIQSSEITWFEDGFLMEWWVNDSLKPQDRRTMRGSLEDAINIAKYNNILLCIQPAYQDQVIFVDYTQRCNNCDYMNEFEKDKRWCTLRDEPVKSDEYCKFWVYKYGN